MQLKRSKELSQEEYTAAIAEGLRATFEAAKASRDKRNRTLAVELEALRIVVFSDLHRGTGDGADDFRRSHRAYRAALGWYLERGYELWLLGDVEELWENGIEEVMETYEAVLELERRFAAPGGPGLRRFYGNHDLDWSKPGHAKKHLRQWLGGAEVLESMRVQVREGGASLGVLFFAHGHQGTPGSDQFAWISRFAVRFVWRAIQRSQGWLATTPAQSTDIRGKHDRAMFAWAKARAALEAAGERPVLIAGHTHHPVFPGEPPERPTEQELAKLRAELDAERDPARRAALAADVELVAAELWEKPYSAPRIDPPCYFNTGCSSFPDGDVTCLEVSGEAPAPGDDADGRGEIRLMRWLDNDGLPRPHRLAARSLREVLASVDGAG